MRMLSDRPGYFRPVMSIMFLMSNYRHYSEAGRVVGPSDWREPEAVSANLRVEVMCTLLVLTVMIHNRVCRIGSTWPGRSQLSVHVKVKTQYWFQNSAVMIIWMNGRTCGFNARKVLAINSHHTSLHHLTRTS